MPAPLRRLAVREARNAVLVGLVLGVAVSAVQVVLDLRDQRLQVAARMHQLLEVMRGPATQAAFELDVRLADAVVSGLSAHRAVRAVRVLDDRDEVMAAIEVAPGAPSGPLARLAERIFPAGPYRMELRHAIGGSALGAVEVRVDSAYLAGDFLQRAVRVVVGGLVRNLLLAGLLVLLFYYTLTRPLLRIVADAEALDPGAEAGRGVATPRGHAGDELGMLVRVINDLVVRYRRALGERLRAERALAESEARFRAVVDNAPAEIQLKDLEGRYLMVNRRFEELYQVREEEVRGKRPSEVVPPALGRFAEAHDAEVRRSGRVIEREEENELPDRCYTALMVKFPVYDGDGRLIGTGGVGVDITERKRVEGELAYHATHDDLTGLVNRRTFERRLARVIETARGSHSEHALCYLDLDQFKVINDTCGHVAGDELLRQLGRLLSAQVRKRDTLARLGGDEFAVLLERCSIAQARRVAEKIRAAVAAFRFVWGESSFAVGVSIGLVAVTGESAGPSAVLSMADAACYAAKDQGRNRLHEYREDDDLMARRTGEMRWVARLNRALEEDHFELCYQPIIALEGREPELTRAFEVLVRLREPGGQRVPPGAFLPAAERYGLAVRLDRWVVEHTLGWLERQPAILADLEHCAINLSGQSLGDEQMLAFLVERVRRWPAPAAKICFEITETAAITNLAVATRLIRALRAEGCRFALDDFGSGLSSFAYLKSLAVDFIKIDGTFVRDMAGDPVDREMVRSINEIGHVLGKRTIAEFVEDDTTLELLREIGVDYAQGYGIARPAPLAELAS